MLVQVWTQQAETVFASSALPLSRALRDYIVMAGLHNHPFMINLQLGGELVPSEADLALYALDAQRFGMREAWITNGLHTVVIPASEFGRLLNQGLKSPAARTRLRENREPLHLRRRTRGCGPRSRSRSRNCDIHQAPATDSAPRGRDRNAEPPATEAA